MEDYLILLLVPAFAMVAAGYHKGRKLTDERDMWRSHCVTLAHRLSHDNGVWKRRHDAMLNKYQGLVSVRRAREKRRK
jgi:hypothetical protein